MAKEPRRIKPAATIAAAVLLLVGGAAALYYRQERQSVLDHRLVDALRRAHYTDARLLLDQGADANVRLADSPPNRWQVLSDIWMQVRGKRPVRDRSDPPLLLCRPRLERSRKAAVLPPQEEHERELTLEALVQHGANVDAMGHNALTLLQNAAVQDDYTLLRILLKHGASLNPGQGKPPPLNIASGESVPMLIDHGADVNALFIPQRESSLILPPLTEIATPLSHAVAHHDSEAIKLLLEHGAAPHIIRFVQPGTQGRSGAVTFSVASLFEACSGHPGLLDLFLRKYGDINKRNETGRSLLEEVSTMSSADDEWRTQRKVNAKPAIDDEWLARRNKLESILLEQGARPKVPAAK